MLFHFKNCLLLLLLLLPFQLQADDSPYKPKSNTWVLHSEAQTEQEGSYVLLGVSHSFDIQDLQFSDLQRIFTAFKPTLVLLEGGFWPSKSNIESAVDCCGEMGFMTFLAEKSKVQVETWEGDLKQEALAVLEHVSTEELKTYYALRQVPQLVQSGAALDEAMNQLLGRDGMIASDYNIDSKPYNSAALNQALKKLTQSEFTWQSVTSGGKFAHLLEQAEFSTFSNIRTLVDTYRDKSAVKKIGSALAEKQRVMILVGKRHFRPIMQGI